MPKRRPISRICVKNNSTKRTKCSMITKTWSRLCTARCFFPMFSQSRRFRESTRKRENSLKSKLTSNGKSLKNRKCKSMTRDCEKSLRRSTERK